MKDRQDKYRAVFLSPMGREVLGDILMECEFGCCLTPTDPGQIGKYNVAVLILAKLGIFGKGTLPQVLEAFTAVMPEKEQENEQ